MASRSQEPWSVHDDFVLMMLVGQNTYEQIGLRLGRTASAVQRRASYKGYSAHGEKRSAQTAQKIKHATLRLTQLQSTAEDLAEYLPETD